MALKKVKGIKNEEVNAFSHWGISLIGFRNNEQGEWWLIAQVMVIMMHMISPWPKTIFLNTKLQLLPIVSGTILIFFGIAISIHSLLSLGRNLSPLPSPKAGSVLVTFGAYRKCRHPLYKSLILISTGITLCLFSLNHLLLTLILIGLLIGKARREEKDLSIKYPNYKSYKKKSTAILAIPFLDWE